MNDKNDLKIQIRTYSAQASQFSKQAMAEFTSNNFEQGRVLMKKANEVGKSYRKLIEQLKQLEENQADSVA